MPATIIGPDGPRIEPDDEPISIDDARHREVLSDKRLVGAELAD
jgi:hypothetical protein